MYRIQRFNKISQRGVDNFINIFDLKLFKSEMNQEFFHKNNLKDFKSLS